MWQTALEQTHDDPGWPGVQHATAAFTDLPEVTPVGSGTGFALEKIGSQYATAAVNNLLR